MIFRDREQAGQRLAQELAAYRQNRDVVVLGLPRGGVPVAYQVARSLAVRLDVFIVRKLGVPDHPEYAMGALASGGVRVLSDEVIETLGISRADVERVTANELEELKRREREYRGDRPRPPLAGRIVMLVDDGLATGSTMRAAVRAVRKQMPDRIIVAVPVASVDSVQVLSAEADALVTVTKPDPFFGVGRWYEDFAQTTDDEVKELLQRADRESSNISPRASVAATTSEQAHGRE